jgi:hypothetical protein
VLAGGLFNVYLNGTGYVALLSDVSRSASTSRGLGRLRTPVAPCEEHEHGDDL